MDGFLGFDSISGLRNTSCELMNEMEYKQLIGIIFLR